MVRIRCGSLVTALLCVGVSEAQQHPNIARGVIGAPGTFAGEIDQINMFNGNLSMSIPIGRIWPAKGPGQLDFGLALAYNSNVWKQEAQGSYVQAEPDPEFNAGLGWSLGLGRLYDTYADPFNESGLWVYVSPDGSRHTFYPTLHEGETAAPDWAYTRDGSYLRLKKSSRTIEFQNGVRHKFYGAPSWALQEMRDPFDNVVTVAITDPVPGTQNAEWVIGDGFRSHKVLFAPLSSDNSGRRYLSQIQFDHFGSTTATWSFSYTWAAIRRTWVDTWPSNSDTLSVALLTGIQGPEGLAWSLGYWNGMQPESSVQTAVLQSIALPTQGSLSYEWAAPFHRAACLSASTRRWA